VSWEHNRPWLPPQSIRVADYRSITEDPAIDIVVELVGQLHPAFEIVSSAFKSGKSVVTANKYLLSEKFSPLFQAARSHSAYLGFEASVAGAVPVIKAIREGFAANTLFRVAGILNGTTNYILSSMTSRGCSFQEALADAKRLGYAEGDPSLDLSGKDSAHKLAILSTYGFHRSITSRDIFIEGIDTIEADDIAYAERLGYRIKLLAVAARRDMSLALHVQPSFVPNTHLLANVGGVYNAIYLEGDLFGKSLFYGEGAGGKAAASAVVADIIEIGKKIARGVYLPDVYYHTRAIAIQNPLDSENPWYFRFTALDKPGVLASIAKILGAHRISIASVIQQRQDPQKPVPIVMLTHAAPLGAVQNAIRAINRLPSMKAAAKTIRVEE